MARVLSAPEIAQIAYNAGFRGSALTTAIAVSLAESGGNASAMGDIGLQDATWGPSVGLFQVRSINKQRGTGGVRDQYVNSDPATNAMAAYKISGGGSNFGAWTTYTKGMYKQFIHVAQLAASGIDPNAASYDPAGMSTGNTTGQPAKSPTDGVGQFYNVIKGMLGNPQSDAMGPSSQSVQAVK